MWKKMPGKVPKLAVLCLLLGSLLIMGNQEAAQAKTNTAYPVENVFFYVTNSEGKDVLLKVFQPGDLKNLEHGQQNGQNYYYAYTDNLPTTGYAEGKGLTLPEFVNYVKGRSTVTNAQAATYGATADRLDFMATDGKGVYAKSWTYGQLYEQERYYFPDLLNTSSGWNQNTWEINTSVAQFGVDLATYNALYKDSDPSYYAKRAVFAGGQSMPVILSYQSRAGRTTGSVSDSMDTEPGIKELIAANGGVATGCLASSLQTDYALRLLIPMTEADLMSAHRTAFDNFKWIYQIRLSMANKPAIPSQGTVAQPTAAASLSADGNTLTITMRCDTPGASIYYAVIDNELDNAPQYLYSDPVKVNVTGRDLNTNPISYYMVAVKEGYDNGAIVSKKYLPEAPAFASNEYGNLGEPQVLTAANSVTDAEWQAWLAALQSVAVRYPGSNSFTALSSADYQVSGRTIIIDNAVFSAINTHSILLQATGYADKTLDLNLRLNAPEITAAPYYVIGQDITLTFANELYQSGVSVRVAPVGGTSSSISSTYLNRSVAGQLTILSSYFSLSSCKLNEPGRYTLTISRSGYTPNSQEVEIVMVRAGEEPEPYEFTLSPSPAGTLQVGDTVEVRLNLVAERAFRFYGGEYRLAFDNSALQLNTGGIQSIWEYGTAQDAASGLTLLTFASLDTSGGGQSMAARTELARFSFTVRKPGVYPLTPQVALLTDANAASLPHVSTAAISLQCEGEWPVLSGGDLDNSGKVSAADALLLNLYLQGLVMLEENQLAAADLNTDGQVNNSDLDLLLRHLAGENVGLHN